ncbi:MAG: four helix bundle protein [Daejeonella sp.]
MNSVFNSYLDLKVWIEARKLSKEIYQVTNMFPKEERFGLISQMRRSAVSIPSNIAEGCGRNHTKDSLQFFFISRGSLYELETQLYISFDLDYLKLPVLTELLDHLEIIRKLLSGFINYYQQLKI